MTLALDAELCARIAHLRITARALADSVLAGQHPTRRVGSSIDFAEHREYRPGDDLRTLDSRVFARTDRWVVRRFEHEAEVRAWLALDTSGSMQFHSRDELPTKVDHARKLLLGLGYLMLRQGDRVGGVDMTAGTSGLTPSGPGLAQLERLEASFRHVQEGAKSSLAGALRATGSAATRKALIIVATDAIDDVSSLDELGGLRAAGHAVVLLHVLDPLELDLSLEGAWDFVGLEGEGRLVADVAIVRDAYQRELERFLEETRERCAKAGARYVLARTDVPPERIIAELVTEGSFA
jgi:uncharacterized protein (DUF58 family)